MLCDVCKDTIKSMWPHRQAAVDEAEPGSNSDILFTFYPHHKSYESLCGSRKTCYICYRVHPLVATFLQRRDHRGNGNSDIVTTESLTSANWLPSYHSLHYALGIYLNFSTHATQTVALERSIVFVIEIHPSSILSSFGGVFSSSTDISTCANVVRQWLKSCIDLHPKCVLNRKPNWLPTRLLDLRNVERADISSWFCQI
jgi:hypothetical protein